MASRWWDGIANSLYSSEMSDLLHRVEDYAEKTKPVKERKKFIEQGGWKGRMGGRGLENGGNRFSEFVIEEGLVFQFSQNEIS